MPYNDPLFKLGETMTKKISGRHLKLKNLIDSGQMPEIVDATFITDQNDQSVPYHWGDLETIGYGSTATCYSNGNIIITRKYTGSKPIVLKPQNVVMKNGDYERDY